MLNESIIKKLISSVKCTACGQRYAEDDVKILGHQEDLWFLGVSCSVCHTRCLAAAVIREDRAPEVITDLTKAEQEKFRDVARLTADEVLDMHNFLKDFGGNFSRLFSHR
jgi:C4-type Zn-finger protein